ncbi:MAG: hydantoinase/oxoprolinase family protein [Ramlibacter sp.]|nr:hydantoinase/oxoprolinase family protein [Cryobacterium sp.]
MQVKDGQAKAIPPRGRIGIDVGGTNTDAVLMRGTEVVCWVKTPTTHDVTGGVLNALQQIMAEGQIEAAEVGSVMIGTTHFTNAVVQRRDLAPTAVVRLGLPATQSLPPMVDWPEDLKIAIRAQGYMAHGGLEFDGREISAMDEAELTGIAHDIREKGIRQIAVSAVFSPIRPGVEAEAAAVLQRAYPEAVITLSSDIGRTGLLERESAAALNASLRDLSSTIVNAFQQALADSGIQAPLYFTQNDGTLMSAEFVEQYPVLTIASGPTNSMRGAAFLSGLREAIVVDIGGTTADVGMLHAGFPREASVAVDVGGVRTNFRMPDVISIGLGGGSLVTLDPLSVGPRSVGFRLPEESLVFGGQTLTTSDIAVAAGLVEMGDKALVAHLDPAQVQAGLARIQSMLADAVDRMFLSPEPVPVIVVGGGSMLATSEIAGLPTIKPQHYQVANAVGAAIAQISGEIDRVYSLAEVSRDAALAEARGEAIRRAVAAGADPASIEIVDVEDVPLAYLPGNATRVRVKAVGGLRLA